jgi:hypothetical protein
MRTIQVIAYCLFLSLAGLCQVKDNSPADSPLSFTGTISDAAGSEAVCNITAHNKSTHSIIAFFAKVDIVRADGHRFVSPFGHDHFFASDEMLQAMAPKAGADFDPEYNCGLYGRNNENTKQSPSLTITAVMAQFDDGSLWGDPAAITELMFQRNDAITYLQSLQAAPNITQALAKEPPLDSGVPGDNHERTTRDLTWAILMDKGTPQSQADEINRRLAVAHERATWLK